MLGITLIVIVIAQPVGDASTAAFEDAARRALGGDANIQIQTRTEDPADSESVALAAAADGVVELSWAADGSKARLHCYLSHEARWVDREISFGAGISKPEREALERGRLLGFAVATMFAEEPPPESSTAAPAPAPSPASASATKRTTPTSKPPQPAPTKPTAQLATTQPHGDQPPRDERTDPYGASRVTPARSLEFAAIASSGVHGTAAGLGAMAGLRLNWLGPLWGRLFVAGRTGDIPLAQASTRTAMLGGGLAIAAAPRGHPFEIGLRVDGFASYFDASHLSEDDDSPVRQSRWLPGADAIVEGGVHLAGSTGLFLGGGVETVFGWTEVYTHGERVALVPPWRIVGEFGFKTRF